MDRSQTHLEMLSSKHKDQVHTGRTTQQNKGGAQGQGSWNQGSFPCKRMKSW